VGNSTEAWAVEDKPEKLAATGSSDPFELKKREKTLNKAKQQKQEVMNRRREFVPLTGTEILRRGRTYREKYEVERALRLAQTSTASLGRFDMQHSKLKEPKVARKPVLQRDEETGRVVERVIKRKLADVMDSDAAARQSLAKAAKHSKRSESGHKHKKPRTQ